MDALFTKKVFNNRSFNMYLGIGFLTSGLMMLIWILFETNCRIDPFSEIGLLNIYTPAKPKPCRIIEPASKSKHLQFVEHPLRRTLKAANISDDRIPVSIVRAYDKNTKLNPHPQRRVTKLVRQTVSEDDSHKNPVERILERFRSGMNDLEIAQELGIGRDTVAMALNLDRCE